MRFREIAQALGISINTVQSRYRYGLDKLRSVLEGVSKVDRRPEPERKAQGTKAEAGDVGSIVDAGRQSHGALQPGEARATFKTPS